MINKQKISEHIEGLGWGYTLGCYNEKIDQLKPASLKKVLEAVEEECTDIKVTLNGMPHIVEVATVDSERDLNIMTLKEYRNTYRNNKF